AGVNADAVAGAGRFRPRLERGAVKDGHHVVHVIDRRGDGLAAGVERLDQQAHRRIALTAHVIDVARDGVPAPLVLAGLGLDAEVLLPVAGGDALGSRRAGETRQERSHREREQRAALHLLNRMKSPRVSPTQSYQRMKAFAGTGAGVTTRASTYARG